MAVPQGIEPRPSPSEGEALALCNGTKVVGVGRIELPAFPFRGEPSTDDNTLRAVSNGVEPLSNTL